MKSSVAGPRVINVTRWYQIHKYQSQIAVWISLSLGVCCKERRGRKCREFIFNLRSTGDRKARIVILKSTTLWLGDPIDKALKKYFILINDLIFFFLEDELNKTSIIMTKIWNVIQEKWKIPESFRKSSNIHNFPFEAYPQCSNYKILINTVKFLVDFNKAINLAVVTLGC